jgi:hypothetical protein
MKFTSRAGNASSRVFVWGRRNAAQPTGDGPSTVGSVLVSPDVAITRQHNYTQYKVRGCLDVTSRLGRAMWARAAANTAVIRHCPRSIPLPGASTRTRPKTADARDFRYCVISFLRIILLVRTWNNSLDGWSAYCRSSKITMIETKGGNGPFMAGTKRARFSVV